MIASRKLLTALIALIAGLSACQPAAPALSLEIHPLQGAPDPDTGTFQPLGASQAEVLARRQADRERSVSSQVEYSDQLGGPVLTSRGPGETLTAVLLTDPSAPPRQLVQVRKGDQVLFSADAGLPSPALPLQSLWSYQGSWVLEILFSENEIWEGRIYRDGKLLNQSKGYQDAFGFQLLAGQPFYFYLRDGSLGYSYAGAEHSLPYQDIPHYGCCSASTTNPQPSEDMVAFFARTGEDWYYIELGDFGGD